MKTVFPGLPVQNVNLAAQEARVAQATGTPHLAEVAVVAMEVNARKRRRKRKKKALITQEALAEKAVRA